MTLIILEYAKDILRKRERVLSFFVPHYTILKPSHNYKSGSQSRKGENKLIGFN